MYFVQERLVAVEYRTTAVLGRMSKHVVKLSSLLPQTSLC